MMTACSVASFGTFDSRTLPYTAYRCTFVFFCFFFINNSQTLLFTVANDEMRIRKLIFFLSMFMLLKSQTSAIKYVFSFIPNQSNSEVGSPMLLQYPIIFSPFN